MAEDCPGATYANANHMNVFIHSCTSDIETHLHSSTHLFVHTGEGRICYRRNLVWHNQIVPHFAMVFKNRRHLLRCRGGSAATESTLCHEPQVWLWWLRITSKSPAFETWLQQPLLLGVTIDKRSQKRGTGVTRFQGSELSDFMFC